MIQQLKLSRQALGLLSKLKEAAILIDWVKIESDPAIGELKSNGLIQVTEFNQEVALVCLTKDAAKYVVGEKG